MFLFWLFSRSHRKFIPQEKTGFYSTTFGISLFPCTISTTILILMLQKGVQEEGKMNLGFVLILSERFFSNTSLQQGMHKSVSGWGPFYHLKIKPSRHVFAFSFPHIFLSFPPASLTFHLISRDSLIIAKDCCMCCMASVGDKKGKLCILVFFTVVGRMRNRRGV